MIPNLDIYYQNYTPVGDIIAMATCFVFFALIHASYIRKTKGFLFLVSMIGILFWGAISDILFHMSMDHIGKIPVILHYIPRLIFYFCIFTNLWMYVGYIKEMMHLEASVNRKYIILASIAMVFTFVYEILGNIFGFSFHIKDGKVYTGLSMLHFCYLFFLGMIVFLLYKYHDRVFKQVLYGVVLTIGISLIIIVIQQRHNQSSFTLATFLFPIYALLYLVHSNPYDIESGALGSDAFDDLIRNSYEKGKPLLLMGLYLHDYDDGVRKYPAEILSTIRAFVVGFSKGAILFKLSGGHLVLAINVKKNPEWQKQSRDMIEEFLRIQPDFGYDYKILISETWDNISKENDYEGFFRYLYTTMYENSIKYVKAGDLDNYVNSQYIRRELADIQSKKDMDDPRVKVFCQPVYNIDTDSYDTAEALMRLELPELGMVYPDKFIPIAEDNNYIQILTQIILNKTCRQIREMVDMKYQIRRISVNFSVRDVREASFSETVQKIIKTHDLPMDKIAIEITESQNESDFNVIKERIGELKGSGIKFYLDDFGTGYSNFERIMELPFDIIKFDRSLVVGSGNDDKLYEMVSHLANMFNAMDYDVLYEGIEDDEDEARCIDMGAKYLQGYKYSKPIPIERLKDYFQKIS